MPFYSIAALAWTSLYIFFVIEAQIVLGTLQGCWKLRRFVHKNEEKNYKDGEDSAMYVIKNYSVTHVNQKAQTNLKLDNNGSYNMDDWIVSEIQLNSVVWQRGIQELMFWSRFVSFFVFFNPEMGPDKALRTLFRNLKFVFFRKTEFFFGMDYFF